MTLISSAEFDFMTNNRKQNHEILREIPGFHKLNFWCRIWWRNYSKLVKLLIVKCCCWWWWRVRWWSRWWWSSSSIPKHWGRISFKHSCHVRPFYVQNYYVSYCAALRRYINLRNFTYLFTQNFKSHHRW